MAGHIDISGDLSWLIIAQPCTQYTADWPRVKRLHRNDIPVGNVRSTHCRGATVVVTYVSWPPFTGKPPAAMGLPYKGIPG